MPRSGGEQSGQEAFQAREGVASPGTADFQGALAGTKIPALEDRGKIGGVIGMQVGKGDQLEVPELGTGFSEAYEGPAAGVHQDPGSAVLPDQEAAPGQGVVRNGPAGAEDLDRDPLLPTGFRRGCLGEESQGQPGKSGQPEGPCYPAPVSAAGPPTYAPPSTPSPAIAPSAAQLGLCGC